MSSLLQSIKLGSLTVKNRFVRSATHDYMGNPDGSVSGDQIALYAALAAGEVGMIITGHAYVQHPLGRASVKQNGIFDDHFIPGYQKLAATVKKAGSVLILQVSHAGRQIPPDWDSSLQPVAPSPTIDATSAIAPREMTAAEIQDTIDSFASAAIRAKEAGCDGIQLHIAHGYLLSQFLSPYTNQRLDEWGGSWENRTRILREIMLRIQRAAGAEYPVLAKLNSTDGFTGPAYLQMDDVVATAKLLQTLGLTAIEISGGIREAKGVMSPAGIFRPDQEAYFAPAAKAVKEAANLPVILVGGLRSQQVMQQMLSEEYADMVALSRPLIKEPDLVKKLIAGTNKAECISCNACFNPEGLRCRLPAKQ